MALFKCEVLDSSGKIFTVQKAGQSKESVIDSFFKSNLFPVEIKEIKIKKSRRKQKEILTFTQMMKELLEAKLSVYDALEICSENLSSSTTQFFSNQNGISSEVFESVKHGKSLSDSIYSCSFEFPKIYKKLISIGEKTGSLDNVFRVLCDFLESKEKLRAKIGQSLAYPSVVIILSMITGTFVSFYVLPKLEEMFMEFGSNGAEEIERNITELKEFVSVLSFLGLGIILVLVAVLFACRMKKGAKVFVHKILLKVPIVGKFILQSEIGKISFALETLLKGHISIEDGIREVSDLSWNVEICESLKEIEKNMRKGKSVRWSFGQHKFFPQYVLRWIGIGEETGSLEKTFQNIKKFYESENEKMITKFSSMIEPSITIILGGIMMVIVMKIIVPMFNIYGAL